MLKLCSIVILFLSADQSGIMTRAVLNGLWYRNRPRSCSVLQIGHKKGMFSVRHVQEWVDIRLRIIWASLVLSMSHLTCELSSASGTEQGNAQVGKKGSIKLVFIEFKNRCQRMGSGKFTYDINLNLTKYIQWLRAWNYKCIIFYYIWILINFVPHHLSRLIDLIEYINLLWIFSLSSCLKKLIHVYFEYDKYTFICNHYVLSAIETPTVMKGHTIFRMPDTWTN